MLITSLSKPQMYKSSSLRYKACSNSGQPISELNVLLSPTLANYLYIIVRYLTILHQLLRSYVPIVIWGRMSNRKRLFMMQFLNFLGESEERLTLSRLQFLHHYLQTTSQRRFGWSNLDHSKDKNLSLLCIELKSNWD